MFETNPRVADYLYVAFKLGERQTLQDPTSQGKALRTESKLEQELAFSDAIGYAL